MQSNKKMDKPSKPKKLPFPILYYKSIDLFYCVISKTAAFPIAWNSQNKEFVANNFYHTRFCIGVAFISLTAILYDCSCFPVIIKGDPKELDKMGFGIALAFVLHSVCIICISVLIVPPKRIVAVLNELFSHAAKLNG